MGYYIRVLGKNTVPVGIEKVQEACGSAVVEVVSEDDQGWTELLLRHVSGIEIASIEKNPVELGELGAEELDEFLESVADCQPESAAQWLRQYLPCVKVIYAFQLLSGTDVDDGWTSLHGVYNAVWACTGGILQADEEGFSNEDGYTIIWQFSDTVKGSWNVGVLIDGKWIHFEMDLGNFVHREAFLRGEVPDGVNIQS